MSRGPESSLTVRRLTREQRRVFKAILAGRKRTWSTEMDALCLIEKATERNELSAELEFWTAELYDEPEHKQSSLSLVIALGMG